MYLRLLRIIMTGSLVFWLSATVTFAHFPGPPKQGEVGRQRVHLPVSDFTLVDQEGNPFRWRDLRGKIVVVTFIYTSCPDVCPLFTAKLAALQQALTTPLQEEVYFLSITTDPEVDTPAVLKAYAQRFEANLDAWSFLTGSKVALQEVWKAFGVQVKKYGPGQVQHTELTTLIDGQGIRRVNYFGEQWTVQGALQDIATLRTTEQTQGAIAMAVAQEERVFDLSIIQGKVTGEGNVIRVKQEEQVTIRWTTDAPVTLHLHGYDIEQQVTPGIPAFFRFKAYATGRFPITIHGKGGTHGTLLYLEVLPR